MEAEPTTWRGRPIDADGYPVDEDAGIRPLLLDMIDHNAETALLGIGQLDDEVKRLRDIIARAKSLPGSFHDNMPDTGGCEVCAINKILSEA